MTVPHERTRAINWGKELLATIEKDDSIPAPLRARARELDLEYPTAPALRDWLIAGEKGLPAAWATNIASAYELFIAVQWPVVGCEETRRELIATLRHFPDPWTVERIARDNQAIAGWLLPAERYR